MEVAAVLAAVERRRAGNHGDGIEPVGQQGGGGECVRPAAGDPEQQEAVDAECIGEPGDVGRPVGEASPGLGIGEADAGAVGSDHPQAAAFSMSVDCAGLQPAARPAVAVEQQSAVRIAILGESEPAAVGQEDGLAVRHRGLASGNRGVWQGRG